MLGLLRGPAKPAEFRTLEKTLGVTLPDDFKESYLIHNGSDPVSGVLVGLPLMSLAEIGRAWETWADIAADEDLVQELSEDLSSHPKGAVQPLYAHRGWVPFAGDSQNFVALDFAPGPKGAAGQVINAGRDDEVRHAIAGTFAGFMEFVAGLFTAGRVAVNPDEPKDAPKWLGVAKKKADLLTGLPDLLKATKKKR